MNPNDTTLDDALTADVWDTVASRLLTKMIQEFAYETIVAPEPVGDAAGEDRSTYRFDLDDVAYRFEASERMLDTLSVVDGSVERTDRLPDPDLDATGTDATDDWQPVTDPLRLLRDLGATHDDLDGLTEGNLVREYKRTLLADAHVEARRRERENFDPLECDYAHLEGEMTGHPWITYNKGRLGWSYEDYRRYAPERKEPVTLSWAAVRKDRSTFVATADRDHDSLLDHELGDHHGVFRDRLADRGLDPDAYHFVPVHDWQWDESIVPLFADEIARDHVVPLGDGPDAYLPQQSVRTFVNVDHDDKHHVKVPMRILNTLVWRGLPGDRTEVAPMVTEYVQGIYEDDEFLQDEGVILPGEIAGVNYDHGDFTRIDGSPYQYHELLGAVWRESIYTFLDDEEDVLTLSALMHVDGDGVPYVSRLVEESGLSLDEWLREFFDTVLPPLLHFLYKYGTAFSPHGQNAMLVVEDGRPRRLAVKDFVDDVNVSDQPLDELERLPDELRDVLRSEPPEGMCQLLFCGLFVCVLRYVVDVLVEHEDYPEERFWTHARDAIRDYQAAHPELAERFELFDLFQPKVFKLALNRNRLFEYGYDDAPGRPHASIYGSVTNVLHEVDEATATQPSAADD